MRNLLKVLGVIALAAVIGFSFASCEYILEVLKDELDGTTWVYDGHEYSLSIYSILKFGNDIGTHRYTMNTTTFGVEETESGTYSLYKGGVSSADKVTLTASNGTTRTGTLSGKNKLNFIMMTFTKQ
jgi:hypothetical protein